MAVKVVKAVCVTIHHHKRVSGSGGVGAEKQLHKSSFQSAKTTGQQSSKQSPKIRDRIKDLGLKAIQIRITGVIML